MASGLAALLDDIAGIAKIAAASLDDVSAAAGKAGSKAVGVVVDDTAVTPGYAMGFTPDRELPIVWKIALGSLRNKFFFLLPGALLLSAFAPWAVTPLLMLGGAFLCFEAAEKVIEAVLHGDDAADEPEELALSSKELEAVKVSGAIRTDLILSAEIMAISLASVTDQPFVVRAAALAAVGLAITAGVYGVVGFIVKMDDIGLHLAKGRSRSLSLVGRLLVRAMPGVLSSLTVVGTAAMLWVGGGIIVHGLEQYHLTQIPGWVHALQHWASGAPALGSVAGWIAYALGAGLTGMLVGGVIAGVVHLLPKRKKKAEG